MRRRADPASRSLHRKLGRDLFNYTWSLIDRSNRTPEQDDEMVHAAHASRYHWGHAGGALQRSIGEWQISRVYSILGRAEPALYHGRRALEIARRYRLAPFYLAYGYESLARASALAKKRQEQAKYLRLALRAGRRVHSSDDRRMLLEDLESIA